MGVRETRLRTGPASRAWIWATGMNTCLQGADIIGGYRGIAGCESQFFAVACSLIEDDSSVMQFSYIRGPEPYSWRAIKGSVFGAGGFRTPVLSREITNRFRWDKRYSICLDESFIFEPLKIKKPTWGLGGRTRITNRIQH